jgi:thiol-disulfide isomerase/thioredoxin
MGESGVLELNDLAWEAQVEKGKLPVVVMFYTQTCPFCKMMDPYFREYAGEFKDKVTFARIDIGKNQWTAERYAVRSTPTFGFFCGGKPIQLLMGAVYPTILKRSVEEALLHGKECAAKSTEINYEISGYG